MNTLVYVTGNRLKFNVAVKAFQDTNIKLIQENIDTPEIQSTSVEEIAIYSSKWASARLNKAVAVTDAGFYIEALNGFPGPFIKYVNQWFSVDDFINLMKGKTNRSIIIKDCIAYSHPNGEHISFTGIYKGQLAKEPGRKGATPIEQIFIPDGYDIPISEISPDDATAYWSNGTILNELKKYLLGRKCS